MASHIEQGGAQASPTFNAARWLSELTAQGGWYAAMAGGRVALGLSECHCTEAQRAKARQMIASLSAIERDAVEAEVRARAGVEMAA